MSQAVPRQHVLEGGEDLAIVLGPVRCGEGEVEIRVPARLVMMVEKGREALVVRVIKDGEVHAILDLQIGLIRGAALLAIEDDREALRRRGAPDSPRYLDRAVAVDLRVTRS